MATRTNILQHRIVVDNKQAIREIDQYTGKVKRSASTVNRSNKATASSFKDVGVQLAAVAAGGVAAAVAFDKMVSKGEELRGLTRGFETLTARVGETSNIFLGRMRGASRGFITDAELMRQANNALILGLPVTADTMADLTDQAIKLGRAMGLDATSSIESMVTGIGRQSRMMLDNLGIVVDTKKAYEAYARELGINADELTAVQQKQAFFNETMKIATEATKGLTADTTSLGAQLKILKTETANFGNTMVQVLAASGLFDFGTITRGLQAINRELGFLTEANRVIPSGPVTGTSAFAGAAGGGAAAGVAPGVLAPGAPFGIDKIVESREEAALLKQTWDELTQGVGVFAEFNNEQLAAAIDLIKDKVIELRELGLEPLGSAFEITAVQAKQQMTSMEALTKISANFAQAASIAFGQNKAVAYATTIINTAVAVMKVLSQGGIYAIPIAASVAAIGAAQLSVINSASPAGGGGGGGGGGFGAATPQAAPGQQVSIFFEGGSTFIGTSEDELVRRLVDQIERQTERSGVA